MESTSARDLDRRLADLVRSERHLVAQFVVELAGFARRELHRELGYTSLFHYCVRQLGLSKSSAFRRSEVARLIGRFPAIADRLVAGRLSIRVLVELRDVLTEENCAGVLARAEGISQEEAQILAVEIRPRPVPRDVVRALVSAETRSRTLPTPPPAAPAVVSAETKLPPQPSALPPQPSALPRAPPPEVVRPLTPALRRLNVTVSADFIAELEQVRAALSHKLPDGDFEQVVREAFKLVLERDRKRKALTDRPRAQPMGRPPETSARGTSARGTSTPETPTPETPTPETPTPETPTPETPTPETPTPEASAAVTPVERDRGRYVPAAVRRAVWQRDQDRCTWPMGDGLVCGATHGLELDHVLEVVRGGKATLGNLRLLCKSHNLMKAEQNLGRAFMARFRRNEPERDTS